MFSYVSLKQRVPADHPLGEVRQVTGAVLGSLNALYAESGGPSIAPEYILRAAAAVACVLLRPFGAAAG